MRSGIFLDADVAQLAKLGLRNDVQGDTGPLGLQTTTAFVPLGTVELDDGSTVAVSAQAMPAVFWTFKIDSVTRGRRLTVETGSDRLERFWPIVEKLVRGERIWLDPVIATALDDDMLVITDENGDIYEDLSYIKSFEKAVASRPSALAQR